MASAPVDGSGNQGSDQVRSQASTDVEFKMAREAGTISFEGIFRNRHGAGDFTFPEFASEMAREGYSGLDRSILVQFRIHGVTTDFIRELKGLGYTRVPAEKLVEMRIHGVTPEFIQRLEKAGYHKVPIDKMVQMRIFGIEPEMVKAFEEGGK